MDALPAISSTGAGSAAWGEANGRVSTEPGKGELIPMELFLFVTSFGGAQGNLLLSCFQPWEPFSAHLPALAALMCRPSNRSVEMGMQSRLLASTAVVRNAHIR